MPKPDEAPTLTAWVTATDAAAELGLSRQCLHRKVQRGDFKTLHTLGAKPIYVIKRSELEKMKQAREPAA